MKKRCLYAVFTLFCLILGGAYAAWYYQKPRFPIDLVYTWVDGGDEKWQQKWQYWRRQLHPEDEYSVSPARWRDRGELKHSLRSVDEFMPWVRKIFIVTDGQVPKWLNTNHPKIQIVDHKEIFPPDALPVFNSMAIESRIPYIKGLSEHFIYANDDMFAGAPLEPEFFFTPTGKPIVYYDTAYTDEVLAEFAQKYANEMWYHLWMRPVDLVEQKFGVRPKLFIDTHTFAPLVKSDLLQNMAMFADEFSRTTYSKFRAATDMTYEIALLTDYLQNRIVLKAANDVPPKFRCNPAGIVMVENVGLRGFDRPCSFCLNDTQNLSAEGTKRQMQYMHWYFPDKSAFEK